LKERSLYDNLSLKEIFKKLTENPDRVLYNYFFNKYYPKLIWFALIYVKQHSLAEEIVSDVMMNIFKKREKLASSENIEGYIFISVKNQSLKYLRKHKNKVFIDNYENEADLLLTTSETPEFQYIYNEFHTVIKHSIDSLPPKRKLVFRMIKEEGLKYQDVAKLLDLSIKTVETHMGLALKTIHNSIEAYKSGSTRQVPVIAIKK
jgi:RNA polymerase sigma-70 factor (ECF subfamily)